MIKNIYIMSIKFVCCINSSTLHTNEQPLVTSYKTNCGLFKELTWVLLEPSVRVKILYLSHNTNYFSETKNSLQYTTL